MDLSFNPAKQLRNYTAIRKFLGDRSAFYSQYRSDPDQAFVAGTLFPCIADQFDAGGSANGHYFHQDLLVAQFVYRNNPVRHVDVGSRVDGFVAHVAAFRSIDVFDIRKVSTSASNINFVVKDLMSDTEELAACTDSLSCLHTLEHFGLGRYGDPIDYRGYEKGLAALAGMLSAGGVLYLSVPISEVQRFEFNAHRVFSLPFLVATLHRFGLHPERFDYVDDAGELCTLVDWTTPEANRTFGLSYGCGIFTLRKGSPSASAAGAIA
jgi:hypothetical protein